MKNLKELRKQNNYSQIQLGELIGFGQHAISSWEKETREPDIKTLIKLANLFNCSVDYLIGHKEKDAVNNGLIVPAEKKQVVTELLALPKQYFDFIATEIQTCLKLSQTI